jgi:hypothetical protein
VTRLRTERGLVAPVEAHDGKAGGTVGGLGDGFHVLGFAPHPVLRREKTHDPEAPVLTSTVDEVPPSRVDRGGCATTPSRAPRVKSGRIARGVEQGLEAGADAHARRLRPSCYRRCYDPEMIYVSLDCEASGPIPPLYNLLSVGAIDRFDG